MEEGPSGLAIGELLSSAGASGRYSKSEWRHAPVGYPDVADRIAQEVACRFLEPILESVFHAGSDGYRPGRSAFDAVRTARQRCWRYDRVLDLDIKGFFDGIDWELLLKAVRHHADCPWVLLYVERWLKAPERTEDGSVVRSIQSALRSGSSNISANFRHASAFRRNSTGSSGIPTPVRSKAPIGKTEGSELGCPGNSM